MLISIFPEKCDGGLSQTLAPGSALLKTFKLKSELHFQIFLILIKFVRIGETDFIKSQK